MAFRGTDLIQVGAADTRDFNAGEQAHQSVAAGATAQYVQDIRPTARQYHPVTVAIIEEWHQLTMANRILPDEVVFLMIHQLNPREWASYVRRNGTLKSSAWQLLALPPDRRS
jgi:hypothetical protein